MQTNVSAPEIVGCYFEDRFEPRLPAMRLRWADEEWDAETCWELPEGVHMTGAPPHRFGIQLQRTGADAYSIRLLWSHTYLCWSDLSRVQLLTSDLPSLLEALGSDLYALLDQPVHSAPRPPSRAA